MRNNEENQIMRACQHAVNSTGKATLWRNAVGYDSDHKVSYGLGVGSADNVGFIHNSGRMFCLEYKTRTGRISHEQALWANYVNAHGGFCAIVRSVEEALGALDLACNSGAAPALDVPRDPRAAAPKRVKTAGRKQRRKRSDNGPVVPPTVLPV